MATETPEQINLEALKQLAEAATPTAWRAEYTNVIAAGPLENGDAITTGDGVNYPIRIMGYHIAVLNDQEYIHNPNAEADAQFIAAANPQTILRLIAAIQAERERAEAAEAQVRELEAALYVPEGIADEAARLVASLRTEIRYGCGDEGGGYYFDFDAEGLLAEALHAVQREARGRN